MKYALLIGINDYPSAPLRGCLNDIEDVKATFCKRLKPQNVVTLLNADATTINIKNAMNEIVSRLKKGDKLLVWYSGHGVQIQSTDPTEADRLDECLAPVDFAWNTNRVIRDNDIKQIFSNAAKGSKIFFVSDSCHSGDLQRAFSPTPQTARRLLHPEGIIWQEDRNIQPLNNKIKYNRDFVFISGCQSDQTAADANFEGRFNGAFTRCFLGSFAKSVKKNFSLQVYHLLHFTTEELKKQYFSQRPTYSFGHINFFK